MQKYMCDLCGKGFTTQSQLIELNADYKTDVVKEVCHACYQDTQKVLDKVNDIVRDLRRSAVRRFLGDK